MLQLFRRVRFCPMIRLQFPQFHKFDLFFVRSDCYLYILAPVSQALLTKP